MKEDINGKPKFVEINPRLGGSSYFATLAGVNFLEIILDLAQGNKPKINKPRRIIKRKGGGMAYQLYGGSTKDFSDGNKFIQSFYDKE